jgi:hypothetical protein
MGGGVAMKAIVAAVFFSIVLMTGGVPIFFISDAKAQPTAQNSRPQPGSLQYEALWKKCRHAVFRKYGDHQKERKRYVLPSARAVSLTDSCMANGGRIL